MLSVGKTFWVIPCWGLSDSLKKLLFELEIHGKSYFTYEEPARR